MKTHQKKKLEIIIESLLAEQVTEIIDQAGALGYSVIPLIAGKGLSGSWTSEGQVSRATSMVAIMCIMDHAIIDDLLERLFPIVSRQMGVLSVSDVVVIRPDHF